MCSRSLLFTDPWYRGLKCAFEAAFPLLLFHNWSHGTIIFSSNLVVPSETLHANNNNIIIVVISNRILCSQQKQGIISKHNISTQESSFKIQKTKKTSNVCFKVSSSSPEGARGHYRATEWRRQQQRVCQWRYNNNNSKNDDVNYNTIPGWTHRRQGRRSGVGDRCVPLGEVDGLFWTLVERRTNSPEFVKDFPGGMLGGGDTLFVPYRVPTQGQGPLGSFRVGGLLSEGPAGDVCDWNTDLFHVDSSALAAVGIYGSAYFGNGDHGNSHGLALCSDLWFLLTTRQQRWRQEKVHNNNSNNKRAR